MTYYGQWNPPVDQVLHEVYFKDKREGFFIEAGAFDGLTENCCKFFEDSLGWTGINVEPDPYAYKLLCLNRPKCTNINVGLSDKNGQVKFTKAIHPACGEHFGNGSIQHSESHMLSLRREGCKFTEFMIDVISYQTMIEQNNITNIDLMVLDVEGYEIPILNNMMQSVLPKVLCIEYDPSRLKTFSDILLKHNYKLDLTKNNNAFYSQIGSYHATL